MTFAEFLLWILLLYLIFRSMKPLQNYVERKVFDYLENRSKEEKKFARIIDVTTSSRKTKQKETEKEAD